MLENPLHDTKIVHHLYKRDEEDDGGQLGCRYRSVKSILGAIEKIDCTVLTKNQSLLTVSWSKKKTAPVRA